MKKSKLITAAARAQAIGGPQGLNHEINFVPVAGEPWKAITSGIRGVDSNGMMEWRDEKGVFHWTPTENYYDIYFDQKHADRADEDEKKRQEANAQGK